MTAFLFKQQNVELNEEVTITRTKVKWMRKVPNAPSDISEQFLSFMLLCMFFVRMYVRACVSVFVGLLGNYVGL